MDDWVSATETSNFILGDPLLDWLNLYAADLGFKKDNQLPGYDPRLDFGAFIMEQGRRFESAVVNLLRASNPVLQITFGASSDRRAAQAKAAFERGTPVVYQGVLVDTKERITGIPDLLVRSGCNGVGWHASAQRLSASEELPLVIYAGGSSSLTSAQRLSASEELFPCKDSAVMPMAATLWSIRALAS